ncbi:YkvA family protein [Neobacillus sp. D3-1R]|uniref:YkvA family protein n=1 Tax=Neobacillus sp. D3-1R TaxID=3445778 RepID=UPI003F9FB85C
MDDKKYEEGYKKYETAAKDYIEQPEKTKELIHKATKKAADKKNALHEVWDRLHLLFDLVTAWRKGDYKKVPKGSIVMIIATILYFVSPIDIIPDFLVGLGILDDAAVIGFTLKQIASDLDKFKAWKDQEKETL